MAKQWKITGARLDTDIAPAGTGFQRVWQTHYEVTDGPAKGVIGYVRMPAHEYSPESVSAAVSQAVSAHQGVFGL